MRRASARRGSCVIAALEGRQHGEGAASSRPLRGLGGASQRRGRGVRRASGVSPWRGSGVRGESARRGGRHRCVGVASPGRGIRSLSLSTQSVLSLSRYFLVRWCHCRQSWQCRGKFLAPKQAVCFHPAVCKRKANERREPVESSGGHARSENMTIA